MSKARQLPSLLILHDVIVNMYLPTSTIRGGHCRWMKVSPLVWCKISIWKMSDVYNFGMADLQLFHFIEHSPCYDRDFLLLPKSQRCEYSNRLDDLGFNPQVQLIVIRFCLASWRNCGNFTLNNVLFPSNVSANLSISFLPRIGFLLSWPFPFESKSKGNATLYHKVKIQYRPYCCTSFSIHSKQCGILSIITSSIGYIFCHMLDDLFMFDAMNIDH